MRIAIAGVPRAGKTTLGQALAAELGYPLLHGDDLMHMDWSEASAELARRMLAPGPWIIEGVAVSRALRKAIDLTAERPCDRLYFLSEPYGVLSDGQASMGKGCHKVHAELAPELLRRGVQFVSASEHVTIQQASSRAAMPVATPATPVPAPAAQVREPYAGGSRWSGFGGGRGFG
jgi:hypothetical protein